MSLYFWSFSSSLITFGIYHSSFNTNRAIFTHILIHAHSTAIA
jgi:hypothetical protein